MPRAGAHPEVGGPDLIRLPLLAALAATIYCASLFGAAVTIAGCNTTACTERVKARALEQHYQLVWRAAPDLTRTHLRRIAMCESTNNERAISANGLYRGLLQFNIQTWATVGGHGDPASATRWEQWSRGVRLYAARGPQPWPVCGFR